MLYLKYQLNIRLSTEATKKDVDISQPAAQLGNWIHNINFSPYKSQIKLHPIFSNITLETVK